VIVYSDDFLNIKYTGWQNVPKLKIRLNDMTFETFKTNFTYLEQCTFLANYTSINLSIYYFLDVINKK